MVKLKVNPGVCGFEAVIEAQSEDMLNVMFKVTSHCETIARFAELLECVDAYSELAAGIDGKIISSARSAGRGCCAGCVVPNAVFKAMQVASGLALPAAISMDFEQE